MTAIFVAAMLVSSVVTGAISIFNGFWGELLVELPSFVIILFGLFFLRDLYNIRRQHKVDVENNNVTCNLETASNF